MWVGDTIYFTSDREGGKLNLYAYDLKSKQTRKVTSHADWDVLWPSSDASQIVYEEGGYIWRYDTKSGRDERVPIHVYGDFKGTVPEFRNVNIMAVAHGTEREAVLAHKRAIDEHLERIGIPVSYTNVFWGGRSEIKPSEISPFAYRDWCATVGVDPETMRE